MTSKTAKHKRAIALVTKAFFNKIFLPSNHVYSRTSSYKKSFFRKFFMKVRIVCQKIGKLL